MALKNPVSLGKTASTFAFWRGGSKLLPMEIMLIGSVVTKQYSMAGIPRHFTSNCDNRGPSVVIVKSQVGEHEYFFGGYNAIGWTCNDSGIAFMLRA